MKMILLSRGKRSSTFIFPSIKHFKALYMNDKKFVSSYLPRERSVRDSLLYFYTFIGTGGVVLAFDLYKEVLSLAFSASFCTFFILI